MLKRKGSNVYNDLMFLEGTGLIELKEGKAHVRKAPVVDCDALHMMVPLTAQVADRRESGAWARGVSWSSRHASQRPRFEKSQHNSIFEIFKMRISGQYLYFSAPG